MMKRAKNGKCIPRRHGSPPKTKRTTVMRWSVKGGETRGWPGVSKGQAMQDIIGI